MTKPCSGSKDDCDRAMKQIANLKALVRELIGVVGCMDGEGPGPDMQDVCNLLDRASEAAK